MQLKTLKFIKVVSDTVFVMITAFYYDKLRGRLALLFSGGLMAHKGPVGRGQALSGCGHLENF